jgi:hypothetical protein
MGFRVAEYTQTTQTKIDMHKCPFGMKFMKAFLPIDWIFKDGKGRLIKNHPTGKNYKAPKQVRITF